MEEAGGRGPQHSQSLQAWFAHIPGLKVIIPSNPYDAKGMLIAALEDNNPVILLEHRWLHSVKGHVPDEYYSLPLEGSQIVTQGTDITIISHSYGVNEGRAAAAELKKYNISAEVIDIRCIKPLDIKTMVKSVEKTKRLIVVDHAERTCGVSSEIVVRIIEDMDGEMVTVPVRLTFPEYPCPTSPGISNSYYITASEIVLKALEQFNRSQEFCELPKVNEVSHDQLNPMYSGPFEEEEYDILKH